MVDISCHLVSTNKKPASTAAPKAAQDRDSEGGTLPGQQGRLPGSRRQVVRQHIPASAYQQGPLGSRLVELQDP